MILEPTNNIKAKLGLTPDGRVQKFFTNTCRNYMGRYVPGGQNGVLNKNARARYDYVDYESPYAHYQYVGILYVDPNTGSPYAPKGQHKVPTHTPLRYHTPGTGSYWDRRMWSVNKDKIIKETEEFMKRG